MTDFGARRAILLPVESSLLVGRIGAAALALGIGGGLSAFGGAATAHAAPQQQHTGPNVSVSVNGVGFSSGSAHATSSIGSAAVAIGANSSASATNGVLNRAIVIGQNSSATVKNGNLNSAVVIGDGNTVTVANGNGNSAYVRGNGNGTVFVGGGNGNRATIIGDQNSAVAGCFAANTDGRCPNAEDNTPRTANHNTVVIRGNRNGAIAGSAGDLFVQPTVQRGNTAIVTGDDNPTVWAAWGSDNTAIVQGSRNTGGVIAGLGDRNTAIVRTSDYPDQVSAGGLGDHVPADGNVVVIDPSGGS